MNRAENINVKSKEIITKAKASHPTPAKPDYELRRFRDKKPGKDGILMPLTPRDWETLSDIYGPMAIEARFSSIYSSAVTPKRS